MKRKLILNALLALFLSFGATAGRAESCPEPPPKPPSFQVGVAIENLIPSRLPNFDGGVASFGAVVSLPLGEDAVDVQATLGTSDDVTTKLFQAAYRLNVRTPFLSGFALLGAHFLTYNSLGLGRSFVGGFLGLGAVVPMSDWFALDIYLKTYFQTRPMLALGGAFRVNL